MTATPCPAPHADAQSPAARRRPVPDRSPLTFIKLVRTGSAVDTVEGFAEVVGERVGGGDDVGAGLNFYGAVAAGGLDEFADGPAGLVFDPAADGQGGEDDGEMGFDGVAFAVVDGPGLEVVLGHAERFLDLPELVVGADHEL